MVLLPLRPSCRPSPAIHRRPALLVRTRRSAAAPSEALSATQHGSGAAYTHNRCAFPPQAQAARSTA
eukprot:4919233-Prymnesium_polylepis.1